ncbi:MAG: HK97 gp10 family phage protein [Ruminococcus flavefaciens]|nr:HK97 gp10 family phage protein [Ruminococcus flavefaciens]MCM1232659.1 HK97 gp10 family phage protein [Ruminococcus flavefaciens]
MADSVDIDDFVKALTDAYSTYTDEIKTKVEKGVRKIAREAKADVVAKSPKGKVNLTRGYSHYKDGWTTSATKEKGVFRVTVHNKKYQLVHLLELGHVLRDGTGRVYGEVPAYEHVESTQNNAEKKVDELLEEL